MQSFLLLSTSLFLFPYFHFVCCLQSFLLFLSFASEFLTIPFFPRSLHTNFSIVFLLSSLYSSFIFYVLIYVKFHLFYHVLGDFSHIFPLLSHVAENGTDQWCCSDESRPYTLSQSGRGTVLWKWNIPCGCEEQREVVHTNERAGCSLVQNHHETAL